MGYKSIGFNAWLGTTNLKPWCKTASQNAFSIINNDVTMVRRQVAKWQASGKWRHWLAKNLIKPAPEPEVEAHTGREREREAVAETAWQRERGVGIRGSVARVSFVWLAPGSARVWQQWLMLK